MRAHILPARSNQRERVVRGRLSIERRRAGEALRAAAGHFPLRIVAVFLVPLLILSPYAVRSVAAAEGCTLRPGPTRTVSRIIDGETVQLDDGREVRLIGALAPRAEDAGAAPNAWPVETEAVRLLTGLVLGRTVRLAFGARDVDRYGRFLAHLFVGREGADLWVQGEMLARGAARAYGVPGAFDCGAELRAHERVARDARKGLWALGAYAVLDAEKARRLLGRRSRFAIVSGVVRDVARTKRAIYLNFGSDWKTDFTARIAKEVASAHPAFDQGLDALKGRTVEIRGWIERRNGPLIDIADPGQIDSGAAGVPLVSEKRGSGVAPAGADGSAERGGSLRRETPDAPPENEERPADPLGTKPGALEL